jgi:hypothetical protein
MNGKQSMDLLTSLYDVAGSIRSTLIELQHEIIIAQSKKAKDNK